MIITLYITTVVVTFFFMEGVAWFTHKYVMHGFLWCWHKSHHKVHPHVLEMNDLFAVIFSIPSIVCIAVALGNPGLKWLLFVGIGIFCYGVFYFIFHDIIVHRRIKLPFKAKSRYMKRIIHAHYVHHENHNKENGKSFGFLYASKKYERSESSS